MKLIIVPVGPTLHDLSHHHTISIGGVYASTEMAATQASIDNDPIGEYLDYYLPDQVAGHGRFSNICFCLSALTLHDRLSIEQWVSENCRAPVLMTMVDNTLYFCDGCVRRAQFAAWWSSRRERSYSFELTTTVDDQFHIETWLNDNVDQSKFHVCSIEDRTYVYIRDDNKAIEFRLRWGEEETPPPPSYDDVPF